MTLQQVNLGTPPAGSDGDDPRTAFTRINSNFKALDDMGLTGPVVATREVANLNDASGPGKWIGTAAATNRPVGFTRSSIEVVEEVSGDLMQQATDKATGQIANRVYTASTDAWSAWVIIGSGGGPGPEILPIASGGTGAGTAAGARTNLGLKALATEDVAPVTGGGTGATTAAQARANLGLTSAASAFAGATSGTAGTPGLVPAPAAGDQAKVLSASGEWVPTADAQEVAMLAASYANQQLRIQDIENSIGSVILYPNGGSEVSPANVSQGSRYTIANPFGSGVKVFCVAEILVNGEWGTSGWVNGSASGYGVKASQRDNGSIIVTVGGAGTYTGSSYGGGSINITGNATFTAAVPCRVKAWRIK